MDPVASVNSKRPPWKNPPGLRGLRNLFSGWRPRILAGCNLNKAGATYSLSVNQYHRRKELNYRVRNGNGCGLFTFRHPQIL